MTTVKLAVYLIYVAAFGFLAVLLSRATANDLTRVEVALGALAVLLAVVTKWRLVVRTRRRHKLEEMRDSALW